jgi:serine/threonine-protein kinase
MHPRMSFRCVGCHAEIDRSFKACPHCGEPVTEFLRRYTDEPVDGKYRILERLGAGGMGEVYKVEHIFLRSIRVIKVVRPAISDSEDVHDRFLREAQLATKIQHPNVATLHDFSALPDGSHYMVWEYIEGENLAQVIKRRGVLSPRQAIALAIQALAGLEAIHRAGIVHRDISPENLMIANDHVKIIDLGVAKSEGGDYAVTRTGMFVGKLRYSSPEHLGFLPPGEKIDGRADLYSLAIVLYEMLTGRPPFEATSPHQYILHHSRETELQSLDLMRVPGGSELQNVLRRALERDRNSRFAGAREFAEALEKTGRTLAADEDDTLRLTPPPGKTFGWAPAPSPAAPTVIERPQRQTALFIVIALLVLAFGALATWHYQSQPAAVAAPPKGAPQPQPATTSVDVVPPETETQPPVTLTYAVPKKKKEQPPLTAAVAAPPIAAAPVPPPARAAPPPPPPPTYTEHGDSSANDAALAHARDQLHAVTRVSLDGSGDADLTKQLAEIIRGNDLTLADGSDVVIHFNGKVTRRGFGRKKREADATITKNGRSVFRYQLAPEEYRVGDNPAEAFARVLRDVLGR